MIVQRKGGMTEIIPTLIEKREAVARDHVIELLQNLHARVGRFEQGLLNCEEEARAFEMAIERIRREEREIEQIHATVCASVEANDDGDRGRPASRNTS